MYLQKDPVSFNLYHIKYKTLEIFIDWEGTFLSGIWIDLRFIYEQ